MKVQIKYIILACVLIIALPRDIYAKNNEKSSTNSVVESSPKPIPAGDYKLDKAHASLIFKVNHLGASNYTARFKRFDA